MSKKQREKVDTTGGERLTQSPFAGLLGGRTTNEPEPAREEPTASEPLRFDAKIILRRETKGRGGKTVTRISGLPAAHLEELASRMKKALACGGLVEDADLVLLGNVIDRAAAWLEAEGAKRVVKGN